jgi:hypothetical protein
MVVVWCGVVFLTDTIATPTKVVLSSFGSLVGLWQYTTSKVLQEKEAGFQTNDIALN